MRYRDIYEAPIADMSYHGDMETPGTFRNDDLKKFRDPEWKERVVKLFQNGPFDINLHIVNGDAEGKVTKRTKYTIDRVDTKNPSKYVGLQSPEWAEAILGHPIDTEGKITAILLQNEGGARVGLTPWMVGHRLAHCFFENNSREVNSALQSTAMMCTRAVSTFFMALSKYFRAYDIEVPDGSEEAVAFIAKHVSTFRSGRTGNLRNSGEFLVELLASYIMTGKVEFRRDWIEGGPRPKPELTDLQWAIHDTASRISGTQFSYYLNDYYDAEIDRLFIAPCTPTAPPRLTTGASSLASPANITNTKAVIP